VKTVIQAYLSSQNQEEQHL